MLLTYSYLPIEIPSDPIIEMLKRVVAISVAKMGVSAIFFVTSRVDVLNTYYKRCKK
jgi:hypothetical protein